MNTEHQAIYKQISNRLLTERGGHDHTAATARHPNARRMHACSGTCARAVARQVKLLLFGWVCHHGGRSAGASRCRGLTGSWIRRGDGSGCSCSCRCIWSKCIAPLVSCPPLGSYLLDTTHSTLSLYLSLSLSSRPLPLHHHPSPPPPLITREAGNQGHPPTPPPPAPWSPAPPLSL